MDKRVNRSHYKVIGEELIPKTSYETEKEALNIARNINILPQTIHKFVAYKCSKCGKWHVGRNRTTLTESEKEKILEIITSEYATKTYGRKNQILQW